MAASVSEVDVVVASCGEVIRDEEFDCSYVTIATVDGRCFDVYNVAKPFRAGDVVTVEVADID